MTTPLPDGLMPGGRFARWRAPSDVRYLVSDVDGTLLDTAGLASEPVVAAVKRAHGTGLRVGLATGRMRDAATSLRAQLTTAGPHLLHNGAEVVGDDDEVLVDWVLSDEQIAVVLDLAGRHPEGVLEIYTRHGYVATSLDRRAAPHWQIIGAPPRAVVADAAHLSGQSVLKATFTAFTPESAESMHAAITAAGLNAGSAVSPHTPDLTYVNVTHPDADKGRALAAVARQMGIGFEHVVAVGDANNDLPMLAVAGTAIAMGQAPPEVKAAAHLVTGSVQFDGAASAIDAATGWRTSAARDAGSGDGNAGR